MVDVTSGADLILDILEQIVGLLQSIKFVMFGTTVSFWGMCIVGLVILLVCTVFWKGART